MAVYVFAIVWLLLSLLLLKSSPKMLDKYEDKITARGKAETNQRMWIRRMGNMGVFGSIIMIIYKLLGFI